MNKKSNMLNELTAISPLDGRYWEDMRDLAAYVSEMALIKIRTEIECQYLIALAEIGLLRKITQKEKQFLLNLGPQMTLKHIEQVKTIEKTTRHDIKAIERNLREMLLQTSLKDTVEMIHFGLTSEDVNNISHRLLLKRATTALYIPLLAELINTLVDMAEKNKILAILARTHGQAAVPTTLGKELINIAIRLHKQKEQLEHIQLTGKITGAVGNFNAHVIAAPDIDWILFSRNFIKRLGLKPNLFTTQINPYDDLIESFQVFHRINTIVLDLNQDMWRYISDDWFSQEIKKGEVGSSTMPQKVNPIDFENSEGNISIANSLWEGMIRKLGVSRLQRDLSDSTTMRNVGIGLGHGLLALKSTLRGLEKVRPNITVIEQHLHENWAILTEGVQTLMRVHGIKDPYSLIATLSRGKKLQEKDWRLWIEQLPVQEDLKKQLKDLTPLQYIGYAERLTDLAIREIRSSNTSLH